MERLVCNSQQKHHLVLSSDLEGRLSSCVLPCAIYFDVSYSEQHRRIDIVPFSRAQYVMSIETYHRPEQPQMLHMDAFTFARTDVLDVRWTSDKWALPSWAVRYICVCKELGRLLRASRHKCDTLLVQEHDLKDSSIYYRQLFEAS